MKPKESNFRGGKFNKEATDVEVVSLVVALVEAILVSVIEHIMGIRITQLIHAGTFMDILQVRP